MQRLRHWFRIDDDWVKRREAALIAAEDAMFRAARDRATTEDERAYWDEFIKLRAENARSRTDSAGERAAWARLLTEVRE